MTRVEFFGCTFFAFGPALALFAITIAHDPIRIIIFVASAFYWLLALLISSIIWFIIIHIDETLWFGLICSIFLQEIFRFLNYKTLRKTEKGLEEVAENTRITENKHIIAYTSGLGFGIISGLFALVNVLADMWGPATMGLTGGSEYFFLVSAAQTLCMILLHPFWNIIFFNGIDTGKYLHVGYVVLSHLLVSCITLLNEIQLYGVTLTISYAILIFTGILSFKVAGGSMLSFKRFITCV